ncbi:hypothetical protein [Longimicrobium sp.]|uniref:hypothetical protein n=1 Tax=Longimicrobium sp. TaxID=2029185 RepID=UPI002E36AFD0|nr:hypothetical protein [Longimicrobium sp.]HEX6041648.1 hypothetical protein [Longimicrobium sp.]
MALREFKDSRGTEWTAWDVPPHRVYSNARGGAERRTRVTPDYSPERRSGRDRRRRVMHPHLQGGWICFTAGEEKRRLYPPPEGWEAASDAELEALCQRAEDGARPSR